jgi:hypothetical protein
MLGCLYALLSFVVVFRKMWTIARRRHTDIGELIPLPRDLSNIVTNYLGVVRRCMKCNVVNNHLRTLAEFDRGGRVRLCVRCYDYASWRGAWLFLSPITQFNVFPLLLRCVAYELPAAEWGTFMFRCSVLVYLLMVMWFRALDPKTFDRGHCNLYNKVVSLPGVIMSNLVISVGLYYGLTNFWLVTEGLWSFIAIPKYLRHTFGPKSSFFFSQARTSDDDKEDERQRQILLDSEQRMQVGGFYGF